ncbi:hypothetical protein IWW47_003502 [Coemansia sp. RSA 2052]|nr:hypothetical protein IWW47_003502 [Coemansia sp. RSA 2052]
MAAQSTRELTKRRVDSALSALGPKRPRPGTTAPSPRRAGAATATASNADKFRPWSRDDLLARIATYKIHTWLVQSPHLSPVKCARNGWVNIDCSTLKCPQCAAKLIAELPDDLTGSEEVRWIERLSQMLQSSHNANCPWKGHECSESIYSVPLATSQETVDEICRHAADLLGFAGLLPATEHPLSSFQSGLLRDLRRKALALHGEKSESEAPPGDCDVASALVLALLGWRADPSVPRPAIKCELCFRSVGLWLFRSADGSRTGLAADAASTRGDIQPFNVVDEHRAFCYWAHGSAATPEKPGGSNTPANATSASAVPGWQKTIASILRAKTMSNENNGSSSESSSDADAGEASSGTDDDGSGTDKDSDKAGMGQDEAMFKRLKPFNISAISAAAEAFGIPFSMGLLARATKKLALMTGVAEPSPQSSILTTTSADEHPRFDFLDDPLLAGAHSGWESDRPARADMDSDTGLVEHGNVVEEQSNDDQDDGIPSSIDTSGLASLLGDSSLASALEDPAQAHAILEYVKSLLRAKNQAHPAS